VDANGPPPKVLFYANDDTTLYSIDPMDITAPMVTIGTFDCVGAAGSTSVMTDVAVDDTGKIYGVSPAAVWPLTVQSGGVVHCDAKWPVPYGTHFNGLTVAPVNTVAATEVIIGANATGALYRIDPTSGTPTQVGTLGTDPVTGNPWTLSGDLVFLANGGNPVGFATVRTCTAGSVTNCDYTDTLIEVDVTQVKPGTQSVLKSVRGKVVRGPSCMQVDGGSTKSSFGSIFGIVAYQDKVYGFSRKGDFLEIANSDGTACPVWSNPAIAFAGAGITTLAPVTPPGIK
jgi:hypothetical protein